MIDSKTAKQDDFYTRVDIIKGNEEENEWRRVIFLKKTRGKALDVMMVLEDEQDTAAIRKRKI